MGASTSKGFTVIESLLFLAISGLMIATMIVGVSASLNRQRYSDSVVSLKTVVQEQYAQLSSTQNNRSGELRCGISGTAVPQAQGGAEQTVGQSSCELIGRYMVIDQDEISTYSVLGHRTESAKPAAGTDIEYMQDTGYIDIAIDTASVESRGLEWGSQLAWPTAGNEARSPTTPRAVGILFVRSPDSGQVYTFTRDLVPGDAATITPEVLRAMIVAGSAVPGQGARTLCVDSQGLTLNNDFSIYLNAYATGSNAVETRTNDYMQSLGLEVQC